MNAVKREEEPTQFGFSATRLGMDKSLEKQKNPMPGPAVTAVHQAERH
jgi:hypothetical protein